MHVYEELKSLIVRKDTPRDKNLNQPTKTTNETTNDNRMAALEKRNDELVQTLRALVAQLHSSLKDDQLRNKEITSVVISMEANLATVIASKFFTALSSILGGMPYRLLGNEFELPDTSQLLSRPDQNNDLRYILNTLAGDILSLREVLGLLGEDLVRYILPNLDNVTRATPNIIANCGIRLLLLKNVRNFFERIRLDLPLYAQNVSEANKTQAVKFAIAEARGRLRGILDFLLQNEQQTFELFKIGALPSIFTLHSDSEIQIFYQILREFGLDIKPIIENFGKQGYAVSILYQLLNKFKTEERYELAAVSSKNRRSSFFPEIFQHNSELKNYAEMNAILNGKNVTDIKRFYDARLERYVQKLEKCYALYDKGVTNIIKLSSSYLDEFLDECLKFSDSNLLNRFLDILLSQPELFSPSISTKCLEELQKPGLPQIDHCTFFNEFTRYFNSSSDKPSVLAALQKYLNPIIRSLLNDYVSKIQGIATVERCFALLCLPQRHLEVFQEALQQNFEPTQRFEEFIKIVLACELPADFFRIALSERYIQITYHITPLIKHIPKQVQTNLLIGILSENMQNLLQAVTVRTIGAEAATPGRIGSDWTTNLAVFFAVIIKYPEVATKLILLNTESNFKNFWRRAWTDPIVLQILLTMCIYTPAREGPSIAKIIEVREAALRMIYSLLDGLSGNSILSIISLDGAPFDTSLPEGLSPTALALLVKMAGFTEANLNVGMGLVRSGNNKCLEVYLQDFTCLLTEFTQKYASRSTGDFKEGALAAAACGLVSRRRIVGPINSSPELHEKLVALQRQRSPAVGPADVTFLPATQQSVETILVSVAIAVSGELCVMTLTDKEYSDLVRSGIYLRNSDFAYYADSYEIFEILGRLTHEWQRPDLLRLMRNKEIITYLARTILNLALASGHSQANELNELDNEMIPRIFSSPRKFMQGVGQPTGFYYSLRAFLAASGKFNGGGQQYITTCESWFVELNSGLPNFALHNLQLIKKDCALQEKSLRMNSETLVIKLQALEKFTEHLNAEAAININLDINLAISSLQKTAAVLLTLISSVDYFAMQYTNGIVQAAEELLIESRRLIGRCRRNLVPNQVVTAEAVLLRNELENFIMKSEALLGDQGQRNNSLYGLLNCFCDIFCSNDFSLNRSELLERSVASALGFIEAENTCRIQALHNLSSQKSSVDSQYIEALEILIKCVATNERSYLKKLWFDTNALLPRDIPNKDKVVEFLNFLYLNCYKKPCSYETWKNFLVQSGIESKTDKKKILSIYLQVGHFTDAINTCIQDIHSFTQKMSEAVQARLDAIAEIRAQIALIQGNQASASRKEIEKQAIKTTLLKYDEAEAACNYALGMGLKHIGKIQGLISNRLIAATPPVNKFLSEATDFFKLTRVKMRLAELVGRPNNFASLPAIPTLCNIFVEVNGLKLGTQDWTMVSKLIEKLHEAFAQGTAPDWKSFFPCEQDQISIQRDLQALGELWSLPRTAGFASSR